jgi:hypothetical protein
LSNFLNTLSCCRRGERAGNRKAFAIEGGKEISINAITL